MALTEKQYKEIRDELDTCKKPLFFFHDDPDGLCSFLLLYRYVREGKGICVKSNPKVDYKYVRKVEEYQPDKIFILDLALLEDDFVDNVKVPIIYIDHHGPIEVAKKVKYFNPRIHDKKDNLPVSYLCYEVVKQDMWISAVGCIGDWFFMPFADEFREKYPELLKKDIKKPEDALFNSKLGELVKIFSFVLKGATSDVMKSVKVLTRINDPNEIIKQTTPQGKYLYQRAAKIMDDYNRLLKRALKSVTKDKLIVFKYHHSKLSFTKELANEVLYHNPKKELIICREKSGEMKCSLRSARVMLPPMVEKALIGVEGYGGGHEYACGVCVKDEDFDRFLEQFRECLEE